MKLKGARHSDLKKIAICHQKAFPESFATLLGRSYVMKMLEWYLSNEKTFLYYFEGEDNSVIGYFGGMIKDGSFKHGSTSSTLQYTYKSALSGIIKRPWLLFHKEFLKNLHVVIKNINYKFNPKYKKRISEKRGSDKKEKPTTSSLVVIGVNPDFHGKGYGSYLLKEFEEQSRKFKVDQLQLSVKATNDKAIRAYKANGWQPHEIKENSLSMTKRL